MRCTRTSLLSCVGARRALVGYKCFAAGSQLQAGGEGLQRVINRQAHPQRSMQQQYYAARSNNTPRLAGCAELSCLGAQQQRSALLSNLCSVRLTGAWIGGG